MKNVLLLVAALRSDHLLIEFQLAEVAFFSILLFVIPFHRCRITTFDFFVGPHPAWSAPLLRWVLGRVSRFLVYFRDSARYEQAFRLDRSKFHLIPGKINGYEIVRRTIPRDEGYIFSGGRSRRDFATLFRAVAGLGYPVKLVTGDLADLAANGSSLDGLTVPGNVEILSHDSSLDFFVDCMAGAHSVVIPVIRDSPTQAGIGVYLQAMALRKCVIVSSGPGVSDVLTEGQAMIVPAGDAEALRDAIRRVWDEPTLRDRYAEAGFQYAIPLGGEDELCGLLLKALP